MLYNPMAVATAGILIWFLIYLGAPMEGVKSLHWNTLFFMAAGYGAFLVGCVWARQTDPHGDVRIGVTVPDPWNGKFHEGLYWASYGIGLAAMAMRLYDRIILRGISYTDDVTELRDALANSQFSGFSAVASVIIPFCFLPMMLLLASRWDWRRWPLIVAAGLLFIAPMVESMAQLSRSISLLTVAIAVFAVSCMKFQGRLLHRRLLLPLAVGAVLVAFYSAAAFTQRLEGYGRSLESSLAESAYADPFAITQAAAEGLRSGSPLVKNYYETVLPNAMYYTSGIYEFDMLLNRPDEQFFGFGSYIFYPYARVLAVFFGEENIRGLRDETVVYRIGVFTSFFGPIWIDFGWMTFLLMILIGFGMERLATFTKLGYLNIAPMYFMMSVVILYAPVFNFLVNGFGFFMAHGFALFALFSSFTPDGARAAHEVAGTAP